MRIFDYKQATVIENRLCDGSFWIKRADDRARIEFDYYRRLSDWCNLKENSGDADDTIRDILLREDKEECTAQLVLTRESSKIYKDFRDALKGSLISTASLEYTALLKKYKTALKLYHRQTKEFQTANKIYEYKLQQLSSREGILHPNCKKIAKLKNSVDLAQKILEYNKLEETAASKHLVQTCTQQRLNTTCASSLIIDTINLLHPPNTPKVSLMGGVSEEVRDAWQLGLKQKLGIIVEKWTLCISSMRKLIKSFNETNSDVVTLLFDKEDIQSSVDRIAYTLYMGIGPSVQDVVDDSKPPTRAPSEISVAGTEHSYSFTYGSDIESIEDIHQIDCNARFIGNNNRDQICVPQSLRLKTHANNGWLKDFSIERETPERRKSRNKSYGSKVKAIKEYAKNNNREISLKYGQRLRLMLPANETGYAFGYKRNKMNRRCFGYFPESHVQDIDLDNTSTLNTDIL